MEWPQITVLVVWFIRICVNASMNGKPKEATNYDLGSTILMI